MRLRWSGDLQPIERSAEVERSIDEVYARFRGDPAAGTGAVRLVHEDPPRRLEWEMTMPRLRDARLTVTLEPLVAGEAPRTRVTSRLEARVVGRLTRRREEVAGKYAAIVEGLLQRTCASLAEPPEAAGPSGVPDR